MSSHGAPAVMYTNQRFSSHPEAPRYPTSKPPPSHPLPAPPAGFAETSPVEPQRRADSGIAEMEEEKLPEMLRGGRKSSYGATTSPTAYGQQQQVPSVVQKGDPSAMSLALDLLLTDLEGTIDSLTKDQYGRPLQQQEPGSASMSPRPRRQTNPSIPRRNDTPPFNADEYAEERRHLSTPDTIMSEEPAGFTHPASGQQYYMGTGATPPRHQLQRLPVNGLSQMSGRTSTLSGNSDGTQLASANSQNQYSTSVGSSTAYTHRPRMNSVSNVSAHSHGSGGLSYTSTQSRASTPSLCSGSESLPFWAAPPVTSSANASSSNTPFSSPKTLGSLMRLPGAKHGQLMVMSAGGIFGKQSWKPRYYVLANYRLYSFKSNDEKQQTATQGTYLQFTPNSQAAVSEKGFGVVEVTGQTWMGDGAMVPRTCVDTVWALQSSGQEEMMDWLNAFRFTISSLASMVRGDGEYMYPENHHHPQEMLEQSYYPPSSRQSVPARPHAEKKSEWPTSASAEKKSEWPTSSNKKSEWPTSSNKKKEKKALPAGGMLPYGSVYF
ncbi:uncharacterized protein EV422DRAFT_539031 [Fimicolochytrium jonesii]|uniref:uncharacterized protein n=1 Tax=Fimicolochytrium jonesii TaxID=1396493 RepID=UPI0022FE3683|nr:uncharacterized protein EV422DRAFT_539031 [Fimicolochytrium jonesii]KAI8818197.1 hypothetical protein EV422DRAFT_539031 [Fimicolochytrium jonesii]